MRRPEHLSRVLLPGIFLLAGACGPSPSPGTVEPQGPTLVETIDSVVTTPPLHRTHWGIEVYDPADDRARFRLNAERHFIPASNTKVVVTAVALAELGPEFRYRTDLYATGAAPFDTVAGDIVVVGRGDPTLSARFHDDEFAAIEALADSVALAGIRRVRGDVIVDATYFEETLVHPAWEVGDLDWYYAAPVAAFGIEEGAFGVAISPGAAPGEPAFVDALPPAEVVSVENRLVTDTAGADFDLYVERSPGTDEIVLSGRIPLLEEPDTVWLAVADPAAYAARALAASLEARGIPVDGDVVVVYDTLAAEDLLSRTRGPIRRLATWTSPPLSEIVAAILQPSQNWIAEQLLKTLGAVLEGVGSWDVGLDVERRYLTEVVGIDSLAFYLRDASGLSAQNLLTPGAIVQLLAHARRMPWGDVYRAALAAPGVEETTLEDRLESLEGRVLAKTGTITHVNALSGYIVAANGRDLIFSILTNGSGLPAEDVRAAIDRIVEAIAHPGPGQARAAADGAVVTPAESDRDPRGSERGSGQPQKRHGGRT